MHKILTINPGSSSIKFSLFHDEEEVVKKEIKMDLSNPKSTDDEINLAIDYVDQFINDNSICEISAVVGRGGLLKPITSGTYYINELMLNELKEAKRGEHPSNLGAQIAFSVAKKLNIPAFIVDPVSVDEMLPIAKISGLCGIQRESLSHALNTKACCNKYAKSLNTRYSLLKLVVAHLGSGISISVHENGQMIDVSNPRDEGPFSIERSGSLPIFPLLKLFIEKGLTYTDIYKNTFKEGGIYSYLKTRNLNEVIKRIQSGDDYAKLIFEAMVYQIAKEIGAMSTVLRGQIDALIITGGMAHCDELISELKSRISFIGRIVVYPGENESYSMATGALRVLNKEEKPLEYV